MAGHDRLSDADLSRTLARSLALDPGLVDAVPYASDSGGEFVAREQTLVLEGSLVDDEGECTAGNFVIRAKGSRHAPTAPNGCTMLVFFLKPTVGLKKALLKNA